MSKETWLPVVGFESEYEVSSLDLVRSLPRIVPCCYGSTRTQVGGILSLQFGRGGYLYVSLSGRRRGKALAVAVCQIDVSSGSVIAEFVSVTEASRQTGTGFSTIYGALGSGKKAKGFFWKRRHPAGVRALLRGLKVPAREGA